MSFDPILGAGYLPRTNPANLSLTESQDMDQEGGAGSIFTANLDFEDIVNVQFVSVTCSFVVNAVGDSRPKIQLKRNEQVINELVWNVNYNTIATNSDQRMIYSVTLQRNDEMRRGDSYIVEVTNLGGTAGMNVTVTTNINIVGMFI